MAGFVSALVRPGGVRPMIAPPHRSIPQGAENPEQPAHHAEHSRGLRGHDGPGQEVLRSLGNHLPLRQRRGSQFQRLANEEGLAASSRQRLAIEHSAAAHRQRARPLKP